MYIIHKTTWNYTQKGNTMNCPRTVGGGLRGQISWLVGYLAASCSVGFSTINDTLNEGGYACSFCLRNHCDI